MKLSQVSPWFGELNGKTATKTGHGGCEHPRGTIESTCAPRRSHLQAEVPAVDRDERSRPDREATRTSRGTQAGTCRCRSAPHS